ncbi:hypothetical protein FHU11_4840 [Serratia fonticola]|nr:hypothetical protein FHU09_1212 [Serratia fonticola]TQI99258.1 hypothetical protein FHU11_4840 [Serratia fonticola]
MVLILLTGCDNGRRLAENYAEQTIGGELKNPSSAKFASVVTYRIKQTDGYADLVHVCGLVDAKNSLGVYTGSTRFVVSFLDKQQPELLAKAIEEPENRAAFEAVYWKNSCKEGHS